MKKSKIAAGVVISLAAVCVQVHGLQGKKLKKNIYIN